MWDLLTGEEIGRLRGHRGTVKCVQVEDQICLTGSEDGTVRVWDLRRVDEDEEWESGEMLSLSEIAEEDESTEGSERRANGIRDGESSRPSSVAEREGACMRVLEGHSKAVTAMYFEDECLVSSFLSSTPHVRPLTVIVYAGHRCIRQDYAPVGPRHRPMCHDHGHPVGYLASSNGGARICTTRPSLPRCGCCCRHVRGPDTTIRGRVMGNVPGFRRGSTVLGLWFGERQRRWRGQDVG